MQNLLLLSLVLTTSLLFTACETTEPNTHMMEDGSTMMDDDSSMMDDEMMGHDMASMRMIQSEEEFLSSMIPHHQEAIDTANIILEKSTNEELKALAQDIVDGQTAEIAQMETWGKEWFGEDFAASEDYEVMMPDLSTLEGEELDQAFIEGMIEHHQMALMMAQQVKMVNEHEELLEMADAIIEAQSAEIKTMKTWLK